MWNLHSRQAPPENFCSRPRILSPKVVDMLQNKKVEPAWKYPTKKYKYPTKRYFPTLPQPLACQSKQTSATHLQIRLHCHSPAGLTISFSLQIPVFSGNEISERKFRQISVNFGRIFLNFKFSNEIFRKIPKFFFPITSENEIFRRISAKFRRNFKSCVTENLESSLVEIQMNDRVRVRILGFIFSKI